MNTFEPTIVESLSGSKIATTVTMTTEVFVRVGMEGDQKIVDVRRFHSEVRRWGEGIGLTLPEWEALKANILRIDQILAELRAPERFRGSPETGA